MCKVFLTKRSKFKVTVEEHMLEPSLHRRRQTVLDVSVELDFLVLCICLLFT